MLLLATALLLIPVTSPTLAALSSLIPYTTLGPDVVNAGGIAALLVNWNASYLPRNASYPTLSFGLSLPIVAGSIVKGAPEILAMMVDVTNFRGGVNVVGQQHYLSITYTTDGNSPDLCAIVYDDMIRSANFTMLFAPAGDALLQAILPKLPGSGATLVSGINTDPADFALNYPNLFSSINTADSTFVAALQIINTAAHSWATQGGDGSANGITTVCIFTANETLLEASADGARTWITMENARRLNMDPIVILLDTQWDMTVTGGYMDYAAAFMACPDNSDVMLLQGASTSGLAVAQALAASRLRPKAVIGLNPATQIDQNNAAELLAAAGWILPNQVELGAPASIGTMGGVFTSSWDVVFADLYWRAGANTVAPQVQRSYSYPAILGFMTAALTAATSLTEAGLRAAILSLNGQTSTGGPIQLSNVTGVNIAPTPGASQISSAGVLVDSTVSILYPVDWPWNLVVAGDPIVSSQNASSIFIALVVAVLGAWVAQIIIEQAIFSRRHGSRLYLLWLAVVALSLGGVAVWCSMLMQSTSLTTSLPGSANSQSVTWSLRVILLALLPSFLLTFCGLWVYISDIESQGVTYNQSQAAIAARTMQEKKRENMKEAALSNRQHLFHLLRAISWRTTLGGILIATAVVLTRVTLWQVWEQDAAFQSAAWAWVVSSLLDVLLISTSVMMFFHALRWRIPAVFVFTAAVFADWQLHVTSLQWTYQPEPPNMVIPLSPSLSSEAVLIIAGVIAAFICFVFIGLQFQAMKLSRNDLTVLVVSLKSAVKILHSKAAEDSRLLTRQHRAVKVLAVALNAVNLVSALPQDYTLPLFLHSDISQLAPPPRPTGRKSDQKMVVSTSLAVSYAIHSRNRSIGSVNKSQLLQGDQDSEHPKMLRLRNSSAVAPETMFNSIDEGAMGSDRSVLRSQNVVTSHSDQEFTKAVQSSLEAQSKHSTAHHSGVSIVSGVEISRTGQGTVSAPAKDNTSFLLTAPLVAQSGEDKGKDPPPLPSLETIIDHPVAVEVFKQELMKTRSVESLVFLLHVRRYHALISSATRKLLALRMADTFIRQDAAQQININTQQRETILNAVDQKGDQGCTLSLFSAAEVECMMLMRSNAWKSFTATSGYRLCAWLCHYINLGEAVQALTMDQATGGELATDLSWWNSRESILTRNDEKPAGQE
jgi:hypothetical protein